MEALKQQKLTTQVQVKYRDILYISNPEKAERDICHQLSELNSNIKSFYELKKEKGSPEHLKMIRKQQQSIIFSM